MAPTSNADSSDEEVSAANKAPAVSQDNDDLIDTDDEEQQKPKPKNATLVDDDDEAEATPVKPQAKRDLDADLAEETMEFKPSPFSKRAKKNPEKVLKEKARNTVKVMIVNPTNGPEDERMYGAVISPMGFFMDKIATDKIFLKGQETREIKEHYLACGSLTPRVVSAFDINGDKVQHIREAGKYNVKSLVVVTEKPHNSHTIKEYINGTLAPLIWNQGWIDHDDIEWKEKGYGEKKNLPKINGDGHDVIATVATWAQAIQDPKDIWFIAGKEMGLKDWLAKDSELLYNLFPEGYVDIKGFRGKYLPSSHLKPRDLANFNAYEAKMQEMREKRKGKRA